MAIKVISMSTITTNWTVRTPDIIVELLKSDEKESKMLWIQWIFDKGRLLIKTVEKKDQYFVSYGKIRNYGKMSLMTIPPIIRDILKSVIGDDILWMVDENSNIIVKNSILPKNCITKEPSILMNMTYASPLNTRIPRNILEYLEVGPGDKVSFLYDRYVTIRKYDERFKSSKLIDITKIPSNSEIYIDKKIRALLDIEDLILWILDNNGNIILKNAILPDICSER